MVVTSSSAMGERFGNPKHARFRVAPAPSRLAPGSIRARRRRAPADRTLDAEVGALSTGRHRLDYDPSRDFVRRRGDTRAAWPWTSRDPYENRAAAPPRRSRPNWRRAPRRDLRPASVSEPRVVRSVRTVQRRVRRCRPPDEHRAELRADPRPPRGVSATASRPRLIPGRLAPARRRHRVRLTHPARGRWRDSNSRVPRCGARAWVLRIRLKRGNACAAHAANTPLMRFSQYVPSRQIGDQARRIEAGRPGP